MLQNIINSIYNCDGLSGLDKIVAVNHLREIEELSKIDNRGLCFDETTDNLLFLMIWEHTP
jgi:hypothetical protein